MDHSEYESPEQLANDAWALVEGRAEIFGSRWPLKLQGSRITRRSTSTEVRVLYQFLTALGFASLEQGDRSAFELVVASIVGPILGGPTIHVGHPASIGMPVSFRDRIEKYCAAASILATENVAPPLHADKDLGVDVISWRPFGDGRGAYLSLLVQCATGQGWTTKLGDISIPTWSGHINWAVRPVRAVAVPFVLAAPEAKWVRYAREGGLILDRPRLLELAAATQLKAPLVKLMRERAANLTAV